MPMNEFAGYSARFRGWTKYMSNWFEEKEKREKESLHNHARLSELFKNDRFAFEVERKKMIEELISSAPDEESRNRLRKFQAAWDKRMKGAGSPHNRFVLAQTFFWDHFNEVWTPAIEAFNHALNQKPVNKGLRSV